MNLEEYEQEALSDGKHKATQKSTWVSVAVNTLLSAFQIVTGGLSGSQGLIADGIHSLSDLVADFVVLIAVGHSKKEADDLHHYGHQRYETVASMILGALLLAVGIGMIWAAVHKLQYPQTIPVVQSIALYVAISALVIKELLFRYMLAVAMRVKSSLLVANAWHARSDAASSLVVAIGISGNLLGYTLLDPIAAIIVGGMVTKMGWSFFMNALHDLTDRAASEEQVNEIVKEIHSIPGILGTHDVKSRKTGDMILLDIHLEIDGNKSVREGHEIAVEARRRVLAKFPVLNLMTHIDPV